MYRQTLSTPLARHAPKSPGGHRPAVRRPPRGASPLHLVLGREGHHGPQESGPQREETDDRRVIECPVSRGPQHRGGGALATAGSGIHHADQFLPQTSPTDTQPCVQRRDERQESCPAPRQREAEGHGRVVCRPPPALSPSGTDGYIRFIGKTGGEIFHEMMLRHDVKHVCKYQPAAVPYVATPTRNPRR